MSADNGIYVLFTETEKGPEYRVTHAQGIDSIYGKFNEESFKYEGNSELLKEYFSEAEVFYTIDEALNYAEDLERNIGYTEDGVCVINEFKEYGHLFG